MNNTNIINMQIEPRVAAMADDILQRLGLSTVEAVSLFLHQVILKGGLPFEIKLPAPNDTTIAAMYDAENDTNLHKFDTAEEMFAALGM